MLKRTLVAAGAGVALGVCFEPLGLVALLPIAVAALVLATRGRSGVAGFVVGLVFGAAYMLTLLGWLRVVGTDAWIGLSLFQSLYYGLLGAGLALISRVRLWPLWSAAAWVGAETFRTSWPFGGFPWGRLAFATADTPLANALPYVGAAGVSLLVALTGATLAWTALRLRSAPVRSVGVFAGVVALACLPALVPYDASDPGSERVTVAAVQGNVPGEGLDLGLERREVVTNHVDATLGLAEDVAAGRTSRPDLVIWPESSTDIDPFRDGQTFTAITSAVEAVGAPVLVGAMVDGTDESTVMNQGIAWQPGVGAGDRYTKRHPVPFGEYIPWRRQLEPYIDRLSMIPRDLVRGTRSEPIDVGGIPVADALCFDVAYDDLTDPVRQGASLVTVQTNNATYISTAQIQQQFAISRLRALETGRYVVVAAINGVSGIIAPTGEILEMSEPRTRSVLVQEIALETGLTPAVWIGPWLTYVATAAGLLAAVWGAVTYRRRGRETAPTSAPEGGGETCQPTISVGS